MKRIIISLAIVGAVAAVAAYGTVAFFSDTETSTGNAFTAGAIDLKVDSLATYNGQPVTALTWGQQTPEDIVAQKFFNFTDVKPGDSGLTRVSLHVVNNDAYVCAEVASLTDDENVINEPESAVDTTTAGELSSKLEMTVWKDLNNDGIQDAGEPVLASGHPVNGVMAVYDSTTGAPLAGGTTAYLGVAWSLPSATGNEVQTDSMTGDIKFNVVQSRNNSSFKCNKEFVLTDPSEQNALNAVSHSYPWYTSDVNGLCIDFTLNNPNNWPAYFDFAIDGDLGTYVAGVSNIIGHEGPFNGLPLGNLHSATTVSAHGNATVTKCGTSEIKLGIHYGAEQYSYLDWATFTAQ